MNDASRLGGAGGGARLSRAAQLLHRPSSRTAGVMVAAGAALVPWIAVLAVKAAHPSGTARDWGWVALDVAEAVSLASLGVVAYTDPRSVGVPILGFASAGLLVADAVVDLSTSLTPTQVVAAGAMAVIVELPVAALAVRLARTHPKVP